MTAPASRPLELLFTTFSGGGNVPPVLAAAGAMIARGHRVRIMSEACDRADIEAAGARFVPWTRAPSRPDRSKATDYLRDWECQSPIDGFLRLLAEVMTGPALAYAKDVREELARAPADLVVTSEMLMGVLAGCEAMGQPVVAFGPNICLLPLAGAPSVGGFAAPLDARIQLFDAGLPALNAARAELGLKPLGHLTEQMDAAQALLLATSAAFDFPWEDRPAAIRYVGPLLVDPPGTSWASPWPAGDPRPLVLVGFSTTFQDHVGVLQRTLEGLSRLPVRVLLTTGETIDPAELDAPANAVVVRQAAHVAAMAEASVVVTHGGHGTLIRAVAAGLPTLVVPHGRDQNDNAQRVTARGAGLELAPSAEAAQIEAAVRRLLEEPAFRAAAQALGRAVRADADPENLVRELEAAARAPVAA